MNVLLTTSTLPVRADDGMPRFIFDLATALALHVKITVLAPDSPGASRTEQGGAFAIHRFTYFLPRRWQELALRRGMPENLRRSWMARLQVPTYLLCQTWNTIRLARKLSADVVNAHWLVPQGLTAACAKTFGGRFKLLLHVHSTDVHILRRFPGGKPVARYVVGRSDAIFVTSHYVRDALDRLVGFETGAQIQPMGVDVAKFGSASGAEPDASQRGVDEPDLAQHFVLYVGRLGEVKGVVYLIRAMQQVATEHRDVELVIAGYGPEEESLKREAQRLGMSSRIRFLGQKGHSEVIRLMQRASVVVVPSIVTERSETEGMPTVVVEAMATGSRLVATAVGGITDVVRHGENGWLCRPEDPEDLATKIVIALKDDGSPSVEVAAMRTAQQFDWSHIAKNYVSSMQQMVQG